MRDEIAKVMGFWLQLGVAGFRLDAVPFMLELDGIAEHGEADPHHRLRSRCVFASRRCGDALLLGEVNTELKDLARFFGDEDGDQLNMQFAFLLNQNLGSRWPARRPSRSRPIRTLPDPPDNGGWATFLRNHDELSLDKLTQAQREEIFKAFGLDEGMQLYGHGLRRRTAAMLGGDGLRLRMAWSLMLSLPGTPVIFMGDEIGMGENLDIPDRMSVRVPMQWTGDRSAGFSSAKPDKLVRPLTHGRCPRHVNVAAQRRAPDSLLNWMERLIRRRRETPEFGWGSSELIETRSPALFAHRCEWQGSTVVAVHNLSRRRARHAGAGQGAKADDLLEEREHRVDATGSSRSCLVATATYGYGCVEAWLPVLCAAARVGHGSGRRRGARSRPLARDRGQRHPGRVLAGPDLRPSGQPRVLHRRARGAVAHRAALCPRPAWGRRSPPTCRRARATTTSAIRPGTGPRAAACCCRWSAAVRAGQHVRHRRLRGGGPRDADHALLRQARPGRDPEGHAGRDLAGRRADLDEQRADLLAYRTADVTRANAAPLAASIRAVRRPRGAVPPSGVTGAVFRHGRLFLAGQDDGHQVWSVDVRSGARRLEFEREIRGEAEGLDSRRMFGARMHWLIAPSTRAAG